MKLPRLSTRATLIVSVGAIPLAAVVVMANLVGSATTPGVAPTAPPAVALADAPTGSGESGSTAAPLVSSSGDASAPHPVSVGEPMFPTEAPPNPSSPPGPNSAPNVNPAPNSTPGSASTSPSAANHEWLTELNRLRAAAGAAPVAEDPALTSECVQHVAYMQAHGMTGHAERPSDTGYSAAGNKCAAQANVVSGARSSTDALTLWHGSAPHREAMLRPSLKRVGFAYADGFAALNVNADQ